MEAPVTGGEDAVEYVVYISKSLAQQSPKGITFSYFFCLNGKLKCYKRESHLARKNILLLIFLYLNFLIYRKNTRKDIVHSRCGRLAGPWASAGVSCLYLPSPHGSLGISSTYVTRSDFYGFFEQKSSHQACLISHLPNPPNLEFLM